ncbi:YunC family protein [Sporolactobacillus spathodeae]|uniref:Uncharacterized protein YunC (DUF1805 family) n=1 Tax=Sporolactobacillus spathodeae TaxID=1465502 RepID=A0ABS2Q597_9BACL|nr:DUF1805 domain-containing protein [Sporolactobacillus spathodeae]MBM7656610.1 uncharacterized protein YunC (DUF1805 family) [Sporolactobacillus spathodeae]
MITLEPIEINGHLFKGVTVLLPKTTLLAVAGDKGYIMCGALDVRLLNEKLSDRAIIAGKAQGVRTLADLLSAPLAEITHEAERVGVYPGMTGRDALLQMHR